MNTIKRIKGTSGGSLAEFAVVIALMATLMSTGQVKFSQAGEGGKGKKAGEELDKIGKAANNFYNAMNEEEGAGRFPGQDKWDRNVPGGKTPAESTGAGEGYANADAAITAAEGWSSYQSTATNNEGMNWVSVFGKETDGYEIDAEHTHKINADDGWTQVVSGDESSGYTTTQTVDSNGGNGATAEFKQYVDPVASPYLDGHFIFTIVGGTTSSTPTIIIADFFAVADDFVVVQP